MESRAPGLMVTAVGPSGSPKKRAAEVSFSLLKTAGEETRNTSTVSMTASVPVSSQRSNAQVKEVRMGVALNRCNNLIRWRDTVLVFEQRQAIPV